MSDPASIEHRHLRSAIEYALVMGDEITKRKAAISVPRELRAVSGKARIPTASLGRLRRAIEADDAFRTAIAAGALPELVDPIGILWLQRPDGWEDRVDRLVAEMASEAADADLRTALRREEKRRRAAEQVAVRLRADVVERDASISALQADVDGLRADVVKAEDEAAALRAELIDVRIEARHARDREAAAKAKLDAARQEGGATPAVPESPVPGPGVDVAEFDEIALAARAIGDRITALAASLGPAETASDLQPERITEHRRPLRLPGGVIASSRAAAEFLLRTDAAVVVDGYNVAKLGWPADRLDEQRRRLLDGLENVARRYGTDVTVFFDGSTVVGAHADRRRMVRVAYSPDGVTADDVIRDEVRRLPAARAIVVVTNDAEIVRDVARTEPTCSPATPCSPRSEPSDRYIGLPQTRRRAR